MIMIDLDERDALFAAIHAAPDDDAPRLIFADWLDENGEPERADYFRVRVELKRAGFDPKEMEALYLRLREQFRPRWDRIGKIIYGNTLSIKPAMFSKEETLPDLVRVSVDELLQLMDYDPTWILPESRFAITEGHDRIGTLAAHRYFEFVRHIRFVSMHEKWKECAIPIGAFMKFLESPNLHALCTLDLAGAKAREEFTIAISQCRQMTNLQVLNLASNQMSNHTVEMLFVNGCFPKLQVLTVPIQQPHRDIVDFLVRQTQSPELKEVHIDGQVSISLGRKLKKRYPLKY
jgi:uncharacterized protein (TIGR02996 family)